MNARRHAGATVALVMIAAAVGMAAFWPRSGSQAGQDICRIAHASGMLPDEVRESSGLARGRTQPDVFWTHNDSGNEAELYGVSETGVLMARVRVDGARIVDWEDIEAAPCEAGNCLYIADTGDNDGERAGVTVYEIVEPAPGATRVSARAWHARYPGERADAEALFVVRGELYLLTKGRHGPIRLYRFPRTAGTEATLQPVAELGPEPSSAADRVTAATATPDGRWIVVRTHNVLRFHPADRLLAGDTTGALAWDARGLGQPQGEAVAVDDAGTVWLTSEAERGGRAPIARVECRLP